MEVPQSGHFISLHGVPVTCFTSFLHLRHMQTPPGPAPTSHPTPPALEPGFSSRGLSFPHSGHCLSCIPLPRPVPLPLPCGPVPSRFGIKKISLSFIVQSTALPAHFLQLYQICLLFFLSYFCLFYFFFFFCFLFAHTFSKPVSYIYDYACKNNSNWKMHIFHLLQKTQNCKPGSNVLTFSFSCTMSFSPTTSCQKSGERRSVSY